MSIKKPVNLKAPQWKEVTGYWELQDNGIKMLVWHLMKRFGIKLFKKSVGGYGKPETTYYRIEDSNTESE